MAGIGDSTLFPNSKMAAAAQLGQSRFRSGETTSVQQSSGGDTHPIDGLGATGAFSLSRDLLTSFSGSRYTNTSGNVTTINDQTGNARHFTNVFSNPPLLATAGPLNRACADFDGTNDVLQGAQWQSYMTASAKFMVISAIFDIISLTTDASWANSAHVLLASQDATISLNGSTDAGLKKIYASTYLGAGPPAKYVGATILENTPYVFSLRHDSGTLYVGINGTETSVAAANTYTGSNMAMQIGTVNSGGFFNGKVFEAIMFSVVPALAQRNALIADMKAYVGAP